MLAESSIISAYSFAPLTDDDKKHLVRSMTRTFSGGFVTLGQNESPTWRGFAELDALSLFELDHRVDAITMRPERVTAIVDGKRFTRIPAIHLRCGPTRIVVDVITDSQAKASSYPAACKILREVYSRRGDKYVAMPHAEVGAQPRLRNARLVLQGRRYKPDVETEILVLSMLSDGGPHAVGDISAALHDRPDVSRAVYSLACRRRVAINLWSRDVDGMVVRLASGHGSR